MSKEKDMPNKVNIIPKLTEHLPPPPNMTKRYFVVFYTGNINGKSLIGRAVIERANSKYLNLNETEELLMNKSQMQDIVLTSILELSETDYKDFIK